MLRSVSKVLLLGLAVLIVLPAIAGEGRTPIYEPRNVGALAPPIMVEGKYGCLPVVEGRRLVGILTESDFVRLMAEGN